MEMNDKDLEKRIAAEPFADIDLSGLSAGERQSAEAFRDEMQALDRRISAALSVDVPKLVMPELPQIGDDNVVNMPISNKRRLTVPEWIGIAASFLLVAVIGARVLDSGREYPTLAEEVIAHLDHEPRALQVSSEPVAERRLRRVVHRSGAEIDRDLGLITYARSCIINGKEIPHLVMQGESGPITLLLMPGESVDEAVPLEGESINGVILPVGDGSIAIIGERNENIAEIEEQVVDSISWTI
ncbi:MAG: DUF3379 family protein [Woeseiaceae bacterium]|nr:DUF3379 family protein [Woeseiaceae bacterium]